MRQKIGATWLGVDSRDYHKEDSRFKLLHVTPLGFVVDYVEYNFTDNSHRQPRCALIKIAK